MSEAWPSLFRVAVGLYWLYFASQQWQGVGWMKPLIETTVVRGRHGSTLEIGPKRGVSFSSEQEIVVTVDLISLHSLALAGSGDASGQGIKTDALEVSMNVAEFIRIQDRWAFAIQAPTFLTK